MSKFTKPLNFVQLTESIRIYNLTSHPVNIFAEDSKQWEVPPSGWVARRNFTRHKIDSKSSIPVFKSSLGAIVITDRYGREQPFVNHPQNIYITSTLTLNGADTPDNFYAPGEPVKDSDGNLIGSFGLLKIPAKDSFVKSKGVRK